MRVRLNRRRCVVCGNPTFEFTGYIFFESSKTRLYAPFCKEHLDKAPQYANPIFENQAALDLFKQMFPKSYWEDVADKQVLFFDSYKSVKSEL